MRYGACDRSLVCGFQDVCCWHFSDIRSAPMYVRYRGQSGHDADAGECPLMTQSGHQKRSRGQQVHRPAHLSTDPLVSGRVSVATNATAAPTETYQKNQLLWPMLLSHCMTSGAVPPNRATVRLYQVPMPRQRSSVGNSSLIIAGAIELFIA